MNTHADHHRLCKAKAAHDAVLGKIDASLAKKPLTATEEPHLDTKSLIANLDEVAETIDLDVSTILANELKFQFYEQFDHGYEKELHPKQNHPTFNSPKDYFDFAKSSIASW